jgi:signal peptidase I
MKRWKIVTLLTLGVLALLGFGVVASGVLPYRIYVVHTGSMFPTIPSTSAVVVQVHHYRVGQPISFYEQGTVITHRLEAINANGTITTKGDANATDDPWHPKTSAIIGGVVAAPPHLGYWLMYLKNPLGLGSILLAALTCWLLWSFVGQVEPKVETTARRPLSKHTAAPVRHGRQPLHLRQVETARR